MNWYKIARDEERWDVIALGNGIFQLRFDKVVPIMDYRLKDRGDIKEVKIYGMNFLKKVPRGTGTPVTAFLYGGAKNLINELV